MLLPKLMGMCLRAVLPTHLNWLVTVAVDLVDIVEDSMEAGRNGWSEEDSAGLRGRLNEVTGKLEHEIRQAVEAERIVPKRKRWSPRRQ